MSVQQEEVSKVENDSLLARPLYMGAERAAALQEDPEPTQEELDAAAEAALDNKSEDELTAEESNWKKRHGDLRRQNNEKFSELKTTIAALEAKLEATPDWTPPKTQEQLEAFREEFPDTYDILESVAHERLSSVSDELANVRAELASEKKSRSKDLARTTILKRHPDWDDIKETDDFHDWAGTQSDVIQEGIYENEKDGKLAADILDLYKHQAGISTDNPKSPNDDDLKKRASELVARKGTSDKAEPKDEKIWTASEVQLMSLDDYEKLEDVIQIAIEEGRWDETK